MNCVRVYSSNCSLRMTSFELHPGREVGHNKLCYIIAEIGQNHQGDENVALSLIRRAAEIGCDCVKFQKSTINCKFNRKALERPYNSANSFGETYGEHKKFLEFSDEKFVNFKNYAINQGIQFTASAMDSQSIDFLDRIDVPFIKIGSGDVNNYPLVIKAARKGRPLVISTGMHNVDVITKSIDLASKYNNRIVVLQCTSSYPCPISEINLNVISLYQQIFPSKVIGYSGHEVSWPMTFAAVAMGAKVVERHLTLDRSMKGTDHKCSLEPDEFEKLVQNIRSLEQAIGTKDKLRQPSEDLCYSKLGKSVVARRYIKKGTSLKMSDLVIKVGHPPGIEAHRIFEILGRITIKDIDEDETVTDQDLDPFVDRDYIPNPCLETSL